jgi:hypothetical protein
MGGRYLKHRCRLLWVSVWRVTDCISVDDYYYASHDNTDMENEYHESNTYGNHAMSCTYRYVFISTAIKDEKISRNHRPAS